MKLTSLAERACEACRTSAHEGRIWLGEVDATGCDVGKRWVAVSECVVVHVDGSVVGRRHGERVEGHI